MLPARFSREAMERLAISREDGFGFRPRPLSSLLEESGPNPSPVASLPEAASELAAWLPVGLHAVIGVPGIGQFELAWLVAREVARAGLARALPVTGARHSELRERRSTPRAKSTSEGTPSPHVSPAVAALPIDVFDAPSANARSRRHRELGEDDAGCPRRDRRFVRQDRAATPGRNGALCASPTR